VHQPERVFEYLKTSVEKTLGETNSPELKEFAENLNRALKQMFHPSPDAGQIERSIRNNGIFYENKLKALASGQALNAMDLQEDIKYLLLQASSHGKSLPAAFQDAADQALRWLEIQQAANVLNSISGDGYRLEIPFSLGGETVMAQLQIGSESETDRHEEERRNRGTSVLFLLELDGFGKTRVDALVNGTQVSASIYLEEEQAVAPVSRQIGRLVDELGSDGFELVRIDVKDLAELSDKRDTDPVSVTNIRDHRLLSIEV
jgi:hypothetical protein